MASDDATVVGKSDKKSQSRRKKKIRRGRHGKAGTKAHIFYMQMSMVSDLNARV